MSANDDIVPGDELFLEEDPACPETRKILVLKETWLPIAPRTRRRYVVTGDPIDDPVEFADLLIKAGRAELIKET